MFHGALRVVFVALGVRAPMCTCAERIRAHHERTHGSRMRVVHAVEQGRAARPPARYRHRMLTAASDRRAMKASIAVAADLRARIARGDLVAGQALPVESELMVELGVSKGVMREALRILEQQGLVEVRRGVGGGPRVRHPSIAEAAMAVRHLPAGRRGAGGRRLALPRPPRRRRDRAAGASPQRRRPPGARRRGRPALAPRRRLRRLLRPAARRRGDRRTALGEPDRCCAGRGLASHRGRRAGGRHPQVARRQRRAWASRPRRKPTIAASWREVVVQHPAASTRHAPRQAFDLQAKLILGGRLSDEVGRRDRSRRVRRGRDDLGDARDGIIAAQEPAGPDRYGRTA